MNLVDFLLLAALAAGVYMALRAIRRGRTGGCSSCCGECGGCRLKGDCIQRPER